MPSNSKRQIVRRRKRRSPPKCVNLSRFQTVPDSVIVKMRYHQYILIDPATGLAGNHLFRANSIHDPDQTTAGTQPSGHDEWQQFYHHYTVLGSKCSARFISQQNNASQGTALVGVGLQSDTTLDADADNIIQRRDTKFKYMTGLQAGGGRLVTNKVNVRDFMGVKDVSDNNNLKATFGSTPGEQMFYNVFLAPMVGSSDISSTTVAVTIDYIVLLTERKDLLAS